MIRFLSRNLWAIINIPALIFFIYLIKFPEDWKEVIVPTGLIAFILLVLVLSLNPVCKIYPKAKIFRAINKHRRAIGVSVFVYAFVHAISFYMQKRSLAELALYLLHPVILPAVIALIILFALTLTSNNYSIKELGGKRWKKLHKLIYIGEFLIFFHMALQGGYVLVWALIGFIPLFILQWKRRRMENTSVGN